jgi:hypothetical protein
LTFAERLYRVAKTIPGSECIDDLPQTPEQRAAKKADYLFRNRTIVCEQKTLETDTWPKVEKLLKFLEKRHEWPIFYGAWELAKILRKFPDGPEINRRVFDSLTTAVQKAISDANRQIRETKRTFNLPDSGDLLVLANENVTALSPQIIVHKVLRTLQKREEPEGALQFPEINAVQLIVENYVCEIQAGLTGVPSFVVQQEIPDPCNVLGFIEKLDEAWAAFHHVPLKTIVGANLDEQVFRRNPNLDAPSQSQGLSRAELWRHQYAARPYLEQLPNVRLIKYGQRLFAQLSAGFLVECSLRERAESARLMEPWTHFLEEINRRGMDMREFASAIRQVRSTIGSRKPLGPLTRLGRNDLCPCTSGRKFKHCYGRPA